MKAFRRSVCLLLILILCLSLCPLALAYTFPDDQYYEENMNLTHVYAVQVSAGSNYNGAVRRRTEMLSLGLDCFLYYRDGKYRVMCGKFRDLDEATAYRDNVKALSGRDNAYTTNAYLPESAITAFENVYYGAGMDNRLYGYQVTPTGLYFKESDPYSAKVYTVQFSAGTSFPASERNRDAMNNTYGYTSFVYEVNDNYRIMTGAFSTSREAETYCAEIKRNTDQNDAYVTTAWLPSGALDNGLTRNYGRTWICGECYYFNNSGKMIRSEWQKIGGNWYFYDADGTECRNEWIDWKGDWYFVDSNGVMLANQSCWINGKLYNFNASGRCTNPYQ